MYCSCFIVIPVGDGRFRPVNEREKTEDDAKSADIKLKFTGDQSVDVVHPGRQSDAFTFDKIFHDPSTTQEDVYELAARESIEDVIEGYNGTIFAYGQTGSGKTHTMMGPTLGDKKEWGIIPRACAHIFSHIAEDQSDVEYTIKCSFLEIYLENVRDLLNPRNGGAHLKVRETPAKGVWVEGLSEHYATCEQDVYDLLELGAKCRATSSTNMNAVSSRSHSLFILTLTQKLKDGSTKIGRLNLADLAGSEKVGKCLARGTRVLMHDGTFRCVERVQCGDTLMGDDGTPRTVLSLARGREQMARVGDVTSRTNLFTCNKSHILSLATDRLSGIRRLEDGSGQYRAYWAEAYDVVRGIATRIVACGRDAFDSEDAARNFLRQQLLNGALGANGVVDISVCDFLRLDADVRVALQGYAAPCLEFSASVSSKALPHDPYFIGLWLGDRLRWSFGNGEQSKRRRVALRLGDERVERYVRTHVSSLGLDVRVTEDTSDTVHWRHYELVDNGAQSHESLALLTYLKEACTGESGVRVPSVYKTAAPDARRRLLAGLIDCVGSPLDNCHYELCLESTALGADVAFVARSLGLCVDDGGAARLRVLGAAVKLLPTLRHRVESVCVRCASTESARRSFDLSVELLDEDDYFGFTLDGNGRFIVADRLVVTHNTEASGMRLQEAMKINQSLSALGNCINALTKVKRGHVPYRDSKLTHILRESLGGNSKTTLLIACSPHRFNLEETISTLRFGQRAKLIKNEVKVNRQRSIEELEALVEMLGKEVDMLKAYVQVLEAELLMANPEIDLDSLRQQGLELAATKKREGKKRAAAKAAESATVADLRGLTDGDADSLEVRMKMDTMREEMQLELSDMREDLAEARVDLEQTKTELNEVKEQCEIERTRATKALADAKEAASSFAEEKEKLEYSLRQAMLEADGAAEQVQQLRADNDELEAKLRARRDADKESKEACKKAKAEAAEAQRDADTQRRAAAAADERASALQQRVEKLQAEQAELSDSLVALRGERDSLTTRIEAAETQCDEQKKEARAASERLATLSAQVEQSASSLSAANAELDTLRVAQKEAADAALKHATLRGELDALRSAHVDATHTIGEHERTIADYRSRNDALQSQLERAENERAASGVALRAAEESIAELEARVAKLQQVSREAEARHESDTNALAESIRADLEQQNEKLAAAVRAEKERFAEADARANDVQVRAHELERDIKAKTEQLDTTEARVKQLSAELGGVRDELREAKKAHHELEAARGELNVAEERRKKQEEQIGELNDRINVQRTEAARLQAARDELDAERAATERRLNAERDQHAATKVRAEKAERQLASERAERSVDAQRHAAEVARLHEEAAARDTYIAELRAELNSAQGTSGSRDKQVEQLLDDLKRARREVSDAHALQSKQKRSLAQKDERVRQLEREADEHHAKLDSLQLQLDESLIAYMQMEKRLKERVQVLLDADKIARRTQAGKIARPVGSQQNYSPFRLFGSTPKQALPSMMDLSSPDKVGWLIKQGGFVRSWKRRWFVLKGDSLYYFAQPTSEEPNGAIPLDGCFIQMAEEHTRKKNSFGLFHPHRRTFFLVADNKEEMMSWIEELNAKIELIEEMYESDMESDESE